MSDAAAAGPIRSERLTRHFLVVLFVAAALGLMLRLRIIYHYIHAKYTSGLLLDSLRNILMTSFFVIFVVFIFIFTRFLYWKRVRRLGPDGRPLKSLAVLATAMTFVNLVSENIAIYRLNLASYSLLFESFCLYLSVTFVFLYWYWHVDQPPPHLVSAPYGIVFPEEMIENIHNDVSRWKPMFMDYMYFTILSSNCFGPPEGHLLVGMPIKRLHVLHSVCMISVFIVILARAVNTLH